MRFSNKPTTSICAESTPLYYRTKSLVWLYYDTKERIYNSKKYKSLPTSLRQIHVVSKLN